MLKIAVYGKGGIGKSTVTSNLAAAFASMGKKVIQIGCDPKADSTINLLGGTTPIPVMNYMREYDEDPETIEDISKVGYGGVLCIETGGPTPGLGCAGRGIIATFSLLEDLELFETHQPDVVLYDVLGDVVCGGFAAPIREGYASKVLIVTSGEKMALYAANNINNAVKNFEDRSYAKVYGIVLNHRNVENETEKVTEFADSVGLPIVGEVPRSDEITRCEDRGMTVVEGEPESLAAQAFLNLAKELLENPETGIDLGHGIHKVRMPIKSKGKGKSGGARVITVIIALSQTEKQIGLHFIYDKSERENISNQELQEVLKQNGL